MQRRLEIYFVVNSKIIGVKKNEQILAKYLEMFQTHYTGISSDKDVTMGYFLALSVNEDENTAKYKYCTKCPNKGGNNSLKNNA